MMRLTLSSVARRVGGQRRGPDGVCRGVCSDTRLLNLGELFVALRGSNFDGHAFLEQARARGAAGAIVEQDTPTMLPLIVVADTLQALGRLAGSWREQLAATVVAVTGSNGKTTVKGMLAAILGRCGKVQATQGNLNNQIGLPLTLLHLRPSDQYAVVEMGANHPGEIAYLSAIARPSVALITNAGFAHLEGFGSPEGVARAKGEIFLGLQPAGTAIINADDPFEGLWRGLAAGHPVLRFGLTPQAEVCAAADAVHTRLAEDRFETAFVAHTPAGEIEIGLRLIGLHNVRNALAAIAAAIAAGAGPDQIRAGLSGVRPVPGRLEPRPGPQGSWVVDDSYNANPSSLDAALSALEPLPQQRWLVLGEMAELGEQAAKLHQRAGVLARERGAQRLYAVGELSRAAAQAFGPQGRWFPSREELTEALRAELRPGTVVLVKGSRSSHMEQVAEALAPRGGVQSDAGEGAE